MTACIILPLPDREVLRNQRSGIKDAVNLFRTGFRGEHRLGIMGAPVLGEKGKIIGMLYMWGIFFAITKAMLEKDNRDVK
jgi:hypothetical protein